MRTEGSGGLKVSITGLTTGSNLRLQFLGLRVAQLRVIFELPPQFGSYPHPLAYLEWFTSLGNPDPLTGMHTVTRSTRQSRRNAAIVPVTQIACRCHLIGKLGKEISSAWTMDNVLEQQGTYYYVNPYVHVDMFTTFRYC